jgi:hypothetical protein
VSRWHLLRTIVPLDHGVKVALLQRAPIDENLVVVDGDRLPGEAYDTLDQWDFRSLYVDDRDIAALGRMELVANLLDHQALVSVQVGLHAVSIDIGGLGKEKVDQERDDERWGDRL